ncbi:MAG: hypothetical protein ACI8ZF_000730 [Candidatus Midichloriaceae bacterium]|jgi:hypothetical protein
MKRLNIGKDVEFIITSPINKRVDGLKMIKIDVNNSLEDSESIGDEYRMLHERKNKKSIKINLQGTYINTKEIDYLYKSSFTCSEVRCKVHLKDGIDIEGSFLISDFQMEISSHNLINVTFTLLNNGKYSI